MFPVTVGQLSADKLDGNGIRPGASTALDPPMLSVGYVAPEPVGPEAPESAGHAAPEPAGPTAPAVTEAAAGFVALRGADFSWELPLGALEGQGAVLAVQGGIHAVQGVQATGPLLVSGGGRGGGEPRLNWSATDLTAEPTAASPSPSRRWDWQYLGRTAAASGSPTSPLEGTPPARRPGARSPAAAGSPPERLLRNRSLFSSFRGAGGKAEPGGGSSSSMRLAVDLERAQGGVGSTSTGCTSAGASVLQGRGHLRGEPRTHGFAACSREEDSAGYRQAAPAVGRTLQGLVLQLRPGELMGITGEVGGLHS